MRIGEATNRKELIEALRSERENRLNLRRGHETVWWNNIALLAGDHWARWNAGQGVFVDEDKEDGQVQLVVNHALTTSRTELARLTKNRPIMEVMPASTDQKDLASAKVGQQALAGAEWKYKLRKVRKQALWWMIATGLGAVYVGYDPNDDKDGTKKYVIDPNSGEPTFNPERIKELEQMLEEGAISEVEVEEYPLGDCCFKVFSPFQLLPDPTKLDFEEIQDLITTEVVNVDEARSLWDKKLEPEQVSLGAMEKRAIYRAGLAASLDPEVGDALMVHTYWLLPNYYSHSAFLRAGVMVRFTTNGDILEYSKTFPYNDGRMPFSFYQHVPANMTIWPESILQHIRPINLELDKAMSQIIEAKDYMGNPMWRVATQHQIKGRIVNQAGRIVRYVHVPNVPPPEPIPGMPVPSQMENTVIALRDQILEISGQGETSRGRVPSGVRSGVAVAYLQEEDETKLGPTTENVEEATAYMGSLTLSRFGQYYTTKRILRLYKEGGGFDVLRFKGSDLRGVSDVIPVAGSALPKQKAARQQFVLDLAQMGLEKDPKRLREELELGKGEPDDVDKALAQADRENQMMLLGIQSGRLQIDTEDQEAVSKAMPVKKWHNHAAHLSRHYSVMMDAEFEELSEKHPDIVRLFDEHTAMHEQVLQEQQRDAMAAAEAAKGAPGGMVAPGGGDMATNGQQPEGRPEVPQGGQQ